jgi:hypothetical protein
MDTTKIPLEIADLVFETALGLAQILDLSDLHALSAADEVRSAFIAAALDPEQRLFSIVMREAEMAVDMPARYTIADIDRRPTQVVSAEIAADRVIDVIQHLDPARATLDRVASYIGLELAALWYPRLDGMREPLGLNGTNYRPIEEMSTDNDADVLVKTKNNGIYATVIRDGKLRVLDVDDVTGATWMFLPV